MLHTLYLSFLLFVSGSLFEAKPKSHTVKWVVQKSSKLDIKGKSSVNAFRCDITMSAGADTIECIIRPDNNIILSGEIAMDVLSFNCHSNLITKDLRKTIKAKEYPKMYIRFLTLRSRPAITSINEPVKGWVEVRLAGVVKRMEISYLISMNNVGRIELNGSRKFCFSDFKLSPPKKLGGMIRIKDEFDVRFQLLLQQL